MVRAISRTPTHNLRGDQLTITVAKLSLNSWMSMTITAVSQADPPRALTPLATKQNTANI